MSGSRSVTDATPVELARLVLTSPAVSARIRAVRQLCSVKQPDEATQSLIVDTLLRSVACVRDAGLVKLAGLRRPPPHDARAAFFRRVAYLDAALRAGTVFVDAVD